MNKMGLNIKVSDIYYGGILVNSSKPRCKLVVTGVLCCQIHLGVERLDGT